MGNRLGGEKAYKVSGYKAGLELCYNIYRYSLAILWKFDVA